MMMMRNLSAIINMPHMVKIFQFLKFNECREKMRMKGENTNSDELLLYIVLSWKRDFYK